MAQNTMMVNKFAPVAEYRNVGILERGGPSRAVWNGMEYRTDGKVYVWAESETPGCVEIIAFCNERDVRNVLDFALVGQVLQLEGKSFRLLSRAECIAILCRDQPALQLLVLEQKPCRVWDKGGGGVCPQRALRRDRLNTEGAGAGLPPCVLDNL